MGSGAAEQVDRRPVEYPASLLPTQGTCHQDACPCVRSLCGPGGGPSRTKKAEPPGPPPSPPAGTQRMGTGCWAAGWGIHGLEMGCALRHAGGRGSGLVWLQLWNFALVMRSLGYQYLRHHLCPHPSLMRHVCVQHVNRGADSSVGCTLHPHPASA